MFCHIRLIPNIKEANLLPRKRGFKHKQASLLRLFSYFPQVFCDLLYCSGTFFFQGTVFCIKVMVITFIIRFLLF